MRYENKFAFPAWALDEILNRLYTSKYFFSEIFQERRVNNIYLDSPNYKNLLDNLHGVQNRVKHRIRWYGSGTQVQSPILEFKIKHGELGYKEYLPLPTFTLDTTYSYDAYLKKITRNSQGLPQAKKLLHHDILDEVPTLYNSYLRRYFLSADENFRVTIDRELSYKSISRWYSGMSGFSEEKIVIELKYEKKDIKCAANVIQDLGLRLSRNSKYVIGMQGLYFNNLQFL